MREETGKGEAKVVPHEEALSLGVPYWNVVLSGEIICDGPSEDDCIGICNAINRAIAPLTRKADLCGRMADDLKESPGCGRPVSETLRLAAGILMGHGGGPVQQDLELIADGFDQWLAEFDREGEAKPTKLERSKKAMEDVFNAYSDAEPSHMAQAISAIEVVLFELDQEAKK